MLIHRITLLLALTLFATPLAAQEVEKPTNIVGWLELNGTFEEGQIPFAWLSEQDAGDTLPAVLRQLQTVEVGERYLGLVIHLENAKLRLTQTQAIGEAIQRIRQAGKKVLVYAEVYDLRDYLLASYADQILLQHKGDITLHGLAMEEMYLAGLLEKIGARADLVQIGEFKGANESLTRHKPSEPWEKNISALLDDLYTQTLETLASNREHTQEEIEAWMRDSWTMIDEDLLERGVVDQLVSRDLVDVTGVVFGDDFIWDKELGVVEQTMQMDSPFAIFSMLFKKPTTKTKRPTIAIIHANGPITRGHSRYGDGLFDETSIGSRTLIRAMGKVRDDKNIQGAVLQLDSPGGSALASEVIWQAIREVAETKPVYVAVGPMAASGGYYLAVAGDQIYVHPQTIVGSIGVVGGKIVLGNLYSKIGIHVTQRTRGPLAGMFNSVDPFTIDQRTAVEKSMRNVYDLFRQRVEIGRGARLDDVDAIAKGRLFTGRQAVENGMADKLGTLHNAMQDVATSLDLEEGQYDVLHLPPPISLAEFLDSLFNVRTPVRTPIRVQDSTTLELARRVMGPAAWSSIQRVLSGMMLLQHEPVLTLMPQVIVVK